MCGRHHSGISQQIGTAVVKAHTNVFEDNMGVPDEVSLKFLSTRQGKPRRANEVCGIGIGLHRGLVGFVTIGPCCRDIVVHVGVSELHAAAVSVSEVWPVAAG